MLKSFFREIIHKTPHNFKASLLNDINYLFPTHINPFYAGFGNKETDALSYVTSGVPIEMVFIVNPTGQLRMLHTDYVTSYDELNLEIADLFPTY